VGGGKVWLVGGLVMIEAETSSAEGIEPLNGFVEGY